jgi:hypothetical protein
MLREFFVHYVILGHSERRAIFGETDAVINAKMKKAREANLKPIFCIGETLAEREAGKLESVLRTQITEGLKDISEKDMPKPSSPTNPSGPSAPASPPPPNKPRTPTLSSAPSSPNSTAEPPPRSASNTAAA